MKPIKIKWWVFGGALLVLLFILFHTTDGFKEGDKVKEKPLFEERNLFVPGEGGYPVFRIPGLVVTNKGTLIAYAEARSSTSDWATIDLVMKQSTDGGKTWGPLQVLVKNAPLENTTYNNPLMITEKDRDVVHYLYCKNYHEVFYMKSENGGRDWSSPIDITAATISKFRAEGQQPRPYQWKVVATGPGHGIELRNGRLLVPIWLANGPTDRNHGPSVVATIYSDDKGVTWEAGEIVYNTPVVINPGETTAIELENGSVMLNIRSNTNRRTVTVSSDGISRWSALKLDQNLVDAINFGSSARYSFKTETGLNRILFINANDPAHRKNITLRMSEDEGQTWKYSKVIQPGQGAYSEVNVAPDKTIHVLYEQGIGIKAVRLNAAWVMSGSELENLTFDTGQLSPTFQSGIHDFVLDVREELTSVSVSPKLPVHSDAVVKVNGQRIAAGASQTVPLHTNGETKVSLIVESPKGEALSEYGITVRKSLPKGAMVGYWNFEQITSDGKVPDLSGKHNDGRVSGATLAPGKVGNALRFVNNSVDIVNGEGLDFGKSDFAASLWVKPDQLGEFMTLLWYGDMGAGAKGWYVRTQEYDKVFFRTGGDGAENLAGTSKAMLTVGRWTHIVAQRKSNMMTIYIDGQEVQSKITALTFDVNGQNVLRIGKPKSGDTRSWDGLIDEVQLYNYALSDAEVRQIYDNSKGRNE